MAQSPQGDVQHWPEVGAFAVPPSNSFAAHRATVLANPDTLAFSPEAFPSFDRIIAGKANRPELFDPAHADYQRYAPLRLNLAVLRNDIMGIYLSDAPFAPGDERNVPPLESAARVIGEALALKRPLRRAFWPSLDVELLNMEGDGAVYAYRFLRTQQREQKGILTQIVDSLYHSFDVSTRHFSLPPAETTPFVVSALAPADARIEDFLSAPVERTMPPAKQQVNVLSQDERRESAEHGRIILEFFRNLKLTGKDMQEAMDNGTPQAQEALLEQMETMLEEYDEAMEYALTRNPALAQKKSVKEAEEAAEDLEHAIRLLAEKVKPVSLSQANSISADMSEQPAHLHQRDKHDLGRLSEKMADGIGEAFAEQQEMQREQQQEQEEQQEAAEQAALAHHDQLSGRRRRRRRRGQSSGKSGGGGSGLRRSARDKDSDGSADRFQADRVQAVISGKAAIGQPAQTPVADNPLSRALAQSGIDPRALTGLQMADVKTNDPLRPDDRTAQEQLQDVLRRERSTTKPPM